MNRVTALEARTRFGDLLNRVMRGEEVVITRHDKPVARVVPEGDLSRARVREAVDDLRSLRAEISRNRGLRKATDKEIRSAIELGRR